MRLHPAAVRRRLHEIEIAQARDLDDQNRRRLIKRKRALLIASTAAALNSRQAKRSLRYQVLRAEGLLSEKKRSYRCDIREPEDSNWSVFASQDHSDRSWFDYVGLPSQGFDQLVALVSDSWAATPLTDGYATPRPCDLTKRLLDCRGTVALMMVWLNGTMTLSELGKDFGLTDSEAQKYLDFSIRIGLPKLRDFEPAKIKWPLDDMEYVERMADYIYRYESILTDRYEIRPIAWVDGVRYKIAVKWSRPAEKVQDRSGEKKMNLRKINFIFDPMGRCVAAVWNTPGTWHDGKCCHVGGLYDKMNLIPNGFCVLADTAYKGKCLHGKVIRILKKGELLPAGMNQATLEDLEKHIIRGRQPSEWSNNQHVQFMKRLRNGLSIDDTFNSCLMELSILLHNFRVHCCDRNETKRYFLNLEAFEADPALRQRVEDYGVEL